MAEKQKNGLLTTTGPLSVVSNAAMELGTEPNNKITTEFATNRLIVVHLLLCSLYFMITCLLLIETSKFAAT